MTPQPPEDPPHDPGTAAAQSPVVAGDAGPETTPDPTGAPLDMTTLLPPLDAEQPESRSWLRVLVMTGLIIGAVAVLCCGGFGMVGWFVGPQKSPDTTGAGWSTAPAGTSSPSASASPVEPDPVIELTAKPIPKPEVAVTVTVEKRTITETQSIPYETRTVEDPDLPEGTRTVLTPGVTGIRTLTYEVTVINGEQTGKRLVSDVVTRQPVTEVIAVGTQRASCDPNYSGACVPIARDVDCVGRGNGPKVLVGDFNAEPGAAELAPLWQSLRDAAPNGGDTYPAVDPVKRIDLVTVSPDITVLGAHEVATAASDHRPVIVDLLLQARGRR